MCALFSNLELCSGTCVLLYRTARTHFSEQEISSLSRLLTFGVLQLFKLSLGTIFGSLDRQERYSILSTMLNISYEVVSGSGAGESRGSNVLTGRPPENAKFRKARMCRDLNIQMVS